MLGRLDLATRDVNKVLAAEPNNLTALDVAERVKNTMEEQGSLPERRPASAELGSAAEERKGSGGDGRTQGSERRRPKKTRGEGGE